ncbi:MAG TPA: DNA translocase FtsK 4TM domain-containing protein, partial [Candidatus Eisenbacteria bacterium]|nr:DNA translocase FtsK 4TM domain-containing protein [Candidatus Eisenbacteria bacterium]
MARQDPPNARSERGLSDIVGIVLACASLLLLAALFSYDPADLAANTSNPNKHPHNWIGPAGARVAFSLFFLSGAVAYLMPFLLALYGMAQFFPALSYLKRRWGWALLLLICMTGGLDLVYPRYEFLQAFSNKLNIPGLGGLVGQVLNKGYLFGLLGHIGAGIVFGTVYIVSLYFLTNFHLGEWARAAWQRRAEAAKAEVANEEALEQRARELQKEAKRLEREMAKVAKAEEAEPEPKEEKSGLGQDLKPVPEPMVRDLSVPQARPETGKSKKATPVEARKEPEPVVESVPAAPRDVPAVTTSEILGKTDEPSEKPAKPAKTPKAPKEPAPEPEPVAVEAVAPAVEPTAESKEPEKVEAAEPAVAALPVVAPPAPPAPKPKPAPRKPKPITVASTPMIGNYQLPPMDFLQLPDMTVRSTETKEDLLANARLMEQTLAQFDIEVSLGDITKGPTITRYELHPAPGVKLEKIQALSNNLAAALKAERIHILAPVPGKSSVGIEVPNSVKTKVIMRDLFESDEWRNTKARLPI